MNLSRIDLHMHSTVSDGTDAPAALLGKVREAGLLFFSLTDHDAIAGNKEILARLKEGDPKFITGVEFSCRDENGKYHILGYGFDPDHDAVNSVVKKAHDFRIVQMKERIEFLKNTFSIGFSEQEIHDLFALSNPGKPHLARLLVKNGIAASKDEAFHTYLNNFPEKNRYLRPEDAIEGITKAGGRAVLAHPFFGTTTEWIGSEELEARVIRLKAMGLSGLEAFHSTFSAENVREILSLADKYDLFITAGSDYHGDNKEVKIGGITKEETPYTDAFQTYDWETLFALQSYADEENV